MGNGSLIQRGNSCYFTFIDKNWLWAEYKSILLKLYAANKPISQTDKRIRWRSYTDLYWAVKKSEWYTDGKKNVHMVEELKDLGHMIWFGDKGFWYTKYRVGLRTTNFETKNYDLADYFSGIGIGCKTIKAGKSYRIVFDREGTETYLKMIGHLTPSFMFDKLAS